MFHRQPSRGGLGSFWSRVGEVQLYNVSVGQCLGFRVYATICDALRVNSDAFTLLLIGFRVSVTGCDAVRVKSGGTLSVSPWKLGWVYTMLKLWGPNSGVPRASLVS